MTQMVVSGRATGDEGAAARLTSMAAHAMEVRVIVLLRGPAGRPLRLCGLRSLPADPLDERPSSATRHRPPA